MGDDLRFKVQQILLINSNFKKSINKVFTKKYLISKKQELNNLYIQVEILLISNEEDLSTSEKAELGQTVRIAYNNVVEIINEKLRHFELPKLRFKRIINFVIIANRFKLKMALDVTTASKLADLIPSYNGNPEGAKSFIDAINFVNDVTTEAQKPGVIKLAMTKLTGKARELFAEIPDNLQIIITKITENCFDKTSADLILSSLQNTKCIKSDIHKFTKEVEELCEKLVRAYVREGIPTDVAKKLAQKASVKTIINEAQNNETKMMLKIAKFDNLKEAVNIFIENENTANASAAVFQARTNRRFENSSRNFRPNNSRGGGYSNRNQAHDRSRSNYNNNYNNRSSNRNFNNQNNNRGNRYNHSRNRGNNRYQNQGNQYNNGFPRVYTTNGMPLQNLIHQQQGQGDQAACRSINPNQIIPTYAQIVQAQPPPQQQQNFLGQRV